MKRALIISFLLFICGASGNCATTVFPPLQPLQPLRQIQAANPDSDLAKYTSKVTELPDQFAWKSSSNPDVNYLRLNQVETSLYGKTYNNQDIAKRVSRLEQSLFSRTYPSLALLQRVDNIISNYNQVSKYPNISINTLSKMETKILSRTYLQNDTESRIERLEQKLFGAIQSGDVNSRYEALKTASNNLSPNNISPNVVANGMPNGMNNGMTNRACNRGWGGFANNLGNSIWGGSMTGFTPPINSGYGQVCGDDNYDNYSTFADSGNGYGMYQGNRSNYGYSDSFKSYGSGAGVTILD